MIDVEIYQKVLCEDCKINIVKETNKLTLLQQMRPKRVAKKSVNWICSDCKKAIGEELKKNNR